MGLKKVSRQNWRLVLVMGLNDTPAKPLAVITWVTAAAGLALVMSVVVTSRLRAHWVMSGMRQSEKEHRTILGMVSA